MGGIIASIHYLDNFGQPQILNTSGNWTCNILPALEIALNGEIPFTPLESVEPDAEWIWIQPKILPPNPEPVPVPVPVPVDSAKAASTDITTTTMIQISQIQLLIHQYQLLSLLPAQLKFQSLQYYHMIKILMIVY